MLVYIEDKNLYPIAMSKNQQKILDEEILPKMCEDNEEIRVIKSRPYPRKASIQIIPIKDLKKF